MVWEDIEFWVIWIIASSTKLQKLVLKGKISWVMSSCVSHLLLCFVSVVLSLEWKWLLAFFDRVFFESCLGVSMMLLLCPTYVVCFLWCRMIEDITLNYPQISAYRKKLVGATKHLQAFAQAAATQVHLLQFLEWCTWILREESRSCIHVDRKWELFFPGFCHNFTDAKISNPEIIDVLH
jgi:hypothetical protein